jgi:PAS domain S-box-containing protein
VEQALGARRSVRVGYLVGLGLWLLLVDFVLVGVLGHRLPRPLGVAGSWFFVVLSAALLATLGSRRLASSREQARLLHLQQAALSALGALTEPSLASLSTTELLDEMLSRLVQTLEVQTATVYLFGDDGTDLVSRASVGYPGPADAERRLPVGQGVAGRIAANRQPLVSDNPTEIGELEPDMPALTSAAGCPIVVEDRLLGICVVGATSAKTFNDADIQLLQLVADRVGAGIERSRLDEAERRSRLAAEQARRHVTLLARASKALSTAIDDYEVNMASLVDVVVPDFADWCAVDVVEERGRRHRVAIRHLYEWGIHQSAELSNRFADLEDHLKRAVQLGRTQEVPRRPPGEAGDGATPGGVSCLIAPIRVRGRTLALITFAVDPGRAGFEPSDISAAEEVADRTAIVAERVLLYLELRAREARWRALVEATPAAIVELDVEGRVLLSNRFAATLFGWDNEVAVAPGVPTFAPGTDTELRQMWGRAAEGEQIVDAQLSVPDGRGDQRDLAVSVVPLTAANRSVQGILMLAADVTERRRFQEGLREAQQMEALGQVAGGVAHDLNNLLTVISGYADLLNRRLTLDDSAHQGFDKILGAADRASVLIRQLLTISRREVAKPVVLAPNAALFGISEVLQRALGVDIALRWDLDPDGGNVRVDPGHFEQLVLNLAINARDAMPDGGSLTISTSCVSHGRLEAGSPGACPGPVVRMALTDTGVGMDEETRRRCFEPFFTTKDRSKGTGLGLAAVQGVVEEAGGTIDVESEPGRGTTFSVYLPAVEEEPMAAAAPAEPDAPLRGSETVLVVDDDAGVRTLMRKVLDHDGYLVLEAASGADAIRVADSWEGPIELLVTDVMMPEMRGPDVAAAVRLSYPSIHVLFISAYTHGTALPAEVGNDPLAFLAKPFKPSELGDRVRTILDRRSSQNGSRPPAPS